MNTKHQVIIGIIGGIVGSIITALVVSSGTAQRDKFDTIQCRKLEVVDATGKAGVILTIFEQGGRVKIRGKGGVVDLSTAFVGSVEVRDKFGAVYLSGGDVSVKNKDGELAAVLSVDEDGGVVSVGGKVRKLGAQLGINEHGGYVQVTSKGEGAAIMSINEYGSGAVSTWDKNGYRQ